MRNPVSDTWSDDAYEKPEASGVTKMSDIQTKLDQWKCEKCGVLNQRQSDTCKGCKDVLGLPRYGPDMKEDGEKGMMGNAQMIEEIRHRRGAQGALGRRGAGLDGTGEGGVEAYSKKKKKVKEVPEFAEEA